MTRFWTAGLISLPLMVLLSATAPAATEFEDIPYLQARINQVLEREPTGAEVEWRNQATGNSGVIRVLKTYFPSPDAPCRDYERTTRRPGGGESLVRGTGCRDASGRWGLKEMEESEALRNRIPSSQPPTPEPWEPGAPNGGGDLESASPGLPGGQAQPTGSRGGTQSQGGGQVGVQSQGGTGSTGQASQSQTSVSTSVLPSVSKPESAAEAASEPPEPPQPGAPAPRDSAPSVPEIELPTRSD